MDRILGGIYVSSYQAVAVGMDLKKYKITHVLSVVKGPLPEYLAKEYKVKQIEVDDAESENIIDFFNEANRFIDSALYPPIEKPVKTSEPNKKAGHRGAILIHCSQGVSRSVAFTMAYLMYKYKLSWQNSLYAVQRKRELAQPNDGFMEQLRIYEEALQHSEYVLDRIDLNAENLYREWVFKSQMEDEEARSRFLANDKAYADTEITNKDIEEENSVLENVAGKQVEKGQEKLTQLRCKKCRQPLALSTSFIPHERPDENSRHAQFFTTSANSNRIIGVERASEFCSHIFTEPLNWMKEELQGKGELLGKFYCPNKRCGTKVGTYSWKGSRCSCGKWVVPAISLQTAKVDEAFISLHSNFEKIKHESQAISKQ